MLHLVGKVERWPGLVTPGGQLRQRGITVTCDYNIVMKTTVPPRSVLHCSLFLSRGRLFYIATTLKVSETIIMNKDRIQGVAAQAKGKMKENEER
jgi:hypothetical protein